ncbi:pre-RNA processing PIH1/Nop17-domain-containing protein [Lenzites betulinus]|nr:pre-RNA processing PIH1/Nop17-domain-containing protein [Lenzites betulinus]
MSAIPGTTRISLAPTPGFCIKSTTLNTSSIAVPSPAADGARTVLPIPAGLKVFVNVAWDKNVPAPPERSEAAIERAIAADVALDAADPEDWYVPLIAPEPRIDKDKAGKPAAVFDCIFSATLKSRALRSPEFKTFLVELAFQRIETQYGVQLARQISTPNIASKGKLAPRSVLVPTALLTPAPSPSSSLSPVSTPTAASPTASIAVVSESTPGARKPLIEELDVPSSPSTPVGPESTLKTSTSAPKGILKPTQSAPSSELQASVPALSWSKTEDGRLRIALAVPGLTRAIIPHTTLDLEPRRLVFSSLSSLARLAYVLDLDLSLPDARIEALFTKGTNSGPESEKSARQALTLKRERALDVDGARAEWRVKEGLLVVYA